MKLPDRVHSPSLLCRMISGFCFCVSHNFLFAVRANHSALGDRTAAHYAEVLVKKWQAYSPPLICDYVLPYLSSTAPGREIIRRQRAELLHGNHTPRRIAPSRPHCLCCGWTEVSLSPCAVMALPVADRHFRA